jgi:putative transposase
MDAPQGDTSAIMQRIKLSFAGQYRSLTGIAGPVWQPQYWDHVIRSSEDMNRHIDYIHYNPVKHCFVYSPIEYRLSSFKKFCRLGLYDMHWRESGSDIKQHGFGE